jgi:DNA polymerase-3 subunit epsilon
VSEHNGTRPIPSSWVTGAMVGLDTETTGVDPENDRIVTATVIADIPGYPLEISNWTIDPGVEIPAAASEIHGVTTEHVRENGQRPMVAVWDIWDTIAAYWRDDTPLVIYNAPFDLTLLDRELARHGYGGLEIRGPVICPLTIDRAVDRYRKGKRTLTDLCKFYGVELVNAHTSEADVAATLMIARIIGEKYPAVGTASLEKLNQHQKAWYHNWAMNFAAYLVRSAHEVSAAEEERLRAMVDNLKANARNWPMIPASGDFHPAQRGDGNE